MESALGIIEIRGLATAVMITDLMAKTANVKIANVERTWGYGWLTVKVLGEVAAVDAAIQAGKQMGEEYGGYISSKVIPCPADGVSEVFCQTAESDDTGSMFDCMLNPDFGLESNEVAENECILETNGQPPTRTAVNPVCSGDASEQKPMRKKKKRNRLPAAVTDEPQTSQNKIVEGMPAKPAPEQNGACYGI
ncbi:BMC domain-containing protein [Clostridium minihomine]|uniref:BMC domain-containing protein n=1 Tax=Clostridium minihomine TaxID=2045012 RepID=UPI000C78DDD4|nr:BMC domain-containing protein [Clostridium minihomine]